LRNQAFATFQDGIERAGFVPARSVASAGRRPRQRGAPFELEAIVPTCFADEDRDKTIGVAVRCLGGFRVFSSDSADRRLENRIYPNARAVDRSVVRIGAPA